MKDFVRCLGSGLGGSLHLVALAHAQGNWPVSFLLMFAVLAIIGGQIRREWKLCEGRRGVC